ncbi:PaaI family thioesterase [Phenylobacterium sp.]|uniref:PaaI family thioesterase n=1 Tax=Phenylobacterium sp. TaxID=1871053 RepID=UPI0027324B23|nr:PaaI family thioesterase [Phenylobacterium sp.]MDP3661128.1 PaaI family thioesterase [Phenylobacterium sp.]
MEFNESQLDQVARGMVMMAPQAAALGFELVSVETGRGVMRVPWREALAGDPDTGVIAGGVVTTLLDHVCGLAVVSAVSELGSTPTLDLRIDYMRPAAPRSAITAEAHCYKLTRSIAFVRAQAYDDKGGEPIATAQAAFMLGANGR